MPKKRTDEAILNANTQQKRRFWSQVTKTNDCWLFSKVTAHGYGRFFANGHEMHAHRAARIWLDRKAPRSGMLARHKCLQRNCVRPGHVEWGNAKENIGDKVRDGTNKPWSHCGERHPRAKISDLTAKAIFEAYVAGQVSMEFVAKSFNVKRKTVCNIVHGKSWVDVVGLKVNASRCNNNKGYMRGERHARAKLSPNSIDTARRNIAAGETITAQAKLLGVSRSTLSAALTGKTWRE